MRFFNSNSDANIYLDAPQQEKIEQYFQTFMTNDIGELHAMDFVNEMCIESLNPESFEAWEKIKQELNRNRKLLKKFNLNAGTGNIGLGKI